MNDDAAGNRLLIIDDEPAFGQLIKKVADGSGFEVIATADARSFRKLAHYWRPSVVIMDLQMPEINGIELLRELAIHRCGAHVVLASALDGKTLDPAFRFGVELGLKMGGTLQKPARIGVLRELLQSRKLAGDRLSAAELGKAIAANDLFLEYQPKLDCGRGQISGVEALVRWNHPARGLVRPDEFIPLAEASEQIHDLTDWVVGTAAKQGAAWLSEGLALDVAVNISARNLEAIDLPDRLAARCKEFGLKPTSVILELTETAAMGDALQMTDVLTRLRVKGFRLSIDDFGTGYSSLLQLQRIPFSEIKVDRSFIMQMMSDRGSRVIVEIVIDLAKRLGLQSVAEGVEDEATLRALLALGCDSLQGYHLSRPIAADRIAPFIAARDADQIIRMTAQGWRA